MGMPKIEFRTQMFRGDWDQIWSQKRLLILMEALVRINQSHIKQMKLLHERGLVPSVYPSVYRSGLHYESEKNTEIWPDIPSLLMGTMGKGNYPGPWGDCEDLACYRVAELRENEKVKAKPYAKWRRGPEGNYHYHALVWLPDGRLEDPSLVLGMGREAAFAEAGLAEKFKSGELVPRIQYAKKPDVIAVDPEKPSGFTGGIASKLDAKVLAAARNGVTVSNGDLDDEAYDTNVVVASEETDVDAMIGWNQDARCFVPKTEKAEVRRLMGYANHNKR